MDFYRITKSILCLTLMTVSAYSTANTTTAKTPTAKTKTTEQIKQFAPPQHRCQKNQPWTNQNIAKWLHIPLEQLAQFKVARSLDNKALCTMPTAKLSRAYSKFQSPPRPDQPDKAMAFRMQQLSVKGKVKPEGLVQAIKTREKVIAYTEKFYGIEKMKRIKHLTEDSKTLSVSSVSAPVHIKPKNWIELGPGNIGGRMRTIFIHPADPNRLLAGSVGGGIWKSTDGGDSWSAVNDFMANLAITSIIADPRTTAEVNSTVLYAATGEGFYNIDSLRGFGLFKSTDGGDTWEQLDSTDPTATDSDWYYVNRVAVNSDGVIIATAKSNAVFTSDDNGTTWTKNEPGPNWYSNMYDVKFDPNDKSKAIVGSVNGDCYYTTDTGATWTKSTIVQADSSWLSGRVEIAYAASSANVVYASVDLDSGEIYRSDDGGVTWTDVSNPQHLGGQGWYANTIWVDPTDANHLVIGGLDLHQSTDGGKNWTKISTWWRSPNSPHADHHTIISDPGYNGNDNKRVYIGNDGGLYKADDIENTNDENDNNGWTNLNNGLAITQFYGGGGISGSKIVCGAQDNGTLLQPDQNTYEWGSIFGGDGGFSAVGNKGAGEYYYFGEYVYLMIHRSDNGNNAEYIYEGLTDAENNNANFIAPFFLDPNDHSVMLGGGASLWRSTNVDTADQADVAWSSIKDEVADTRISQITIAEGDSDLVLVGYNNGEIYKSTDATSATPTWTKIHDSNNKNVLALLIDKDDHSIMYAGWGGFANDNLQKSTDGGQTWNSISGGLPQAPMRSIARHPTRADYLYVGTEVGIFTSEDQGATWFADNNGPATVSVDQLSWYDNKTLIAVTHGRGAFKVKVELDPCEDIYRPLRAYNWTLVSFPCQTGDNNISSLLGNALGTYGDENEWVMYEQTGQDDYKGDNTQLRMMEANDTLQTGKGYWLITASDRNMTVDYTLPNLDFVPETNASDYNINDSDFTTVYGRQLPNSDAVESKKVLIGNPLPNSIYLHDVYVSHGSSNNNYKPMGDSDNDTYIKSTVYTYEHSGTDTNNYQAITPDTPGFTDQIDPMTAFWIKLQAVDTDTNYMTFPYEN